jgi:hypothetical protein
VSDDDTSDTVATWCAKRRTSRTQFYRMLKRGEAPDIHYIGNRPRISSAADNRWVREREAEAAAKLIGEGA